ncbi:carcinoembryonic antigen-related cell adhesion molecule 6-like isoform X2 [Talpa occidentalis]|uniref:carcinoembryonic antigen-related cell adhesion molecule 6-like isoform X2 n=1 Tax=Talpa occidentalis TaxID=50954 RepID=UPI0023F75EFE|nr:carcinoembryonic antigen-related cell adhesion molecule 6-like isoform X2 [Talpa occidentalis]
MEAPSAHGRRGRGPWQGLLLAASFLTFDVPHITAKPTVESEPLDAAEGQDVILRVRNLPERFGIYSWYKGGKVDGSQRIASYNVATEEVLNGPAHNGREIMHPNISLLFQNVTQNDTGDYTLRYTNRSHVMKEITGQLCIYLLPKPHITSNNSDPVEHEDTVVLTCGPETPDTTFLWSINSQSLPNSNRLQLSKDNRTLMLLRVTRTDTGPYVCETRNPLCARRSDPLSLNILYGPDTPIIFPPQPYYTPGAALSLSCHAASNPPAQYYWLINGRPQNSTHELFIPNITESDSGSYTCLAHNNATGLNSAVVKNIMVSAEGDTTGLSAGVIAAIVIGVVLAAALGCVLVCRRSGRSYCTPTQTDLRVSWPGHTQGAEEPGKTGDKHSLPERRPPAPTPGSAPSGCSASSAPQLDIKPDVPIYEELLHPDTDIYCQIIPRAQEA